MNSMGARELKLRVVNALVQKGVTFDSEKIQELLEKQQAEEQAAFGKRLLEKANAQWAGNGG